MQDARTINVVLLYGQRVLLIQRETDREWTLIGGAVENGESFEDAIVRYVRRQIGLMIATGFGDPSEIDRSDGATTFVLIAPREPYVVLDRDAHVGCGWFDVGSVEALHKLGAFGGVSDSAVAALIGELQKEASHA